MSAHPPTVFVSYAHESPQHKHDVLRLATVLRACGVTVLLDEWVGDDRVDWAVWAITGIEQSDFVVVVASPRYREVSVETLPSDVHRGVRFEAPLLREHLWRDRTTWFAKLLPVVLPGHSVDEIPVFLQPHSGTHYVLTDISEEGVSALVQTVHGTSRGRPDPATQAARPLPPREQPAVTGAEIRRPELLEPLVRDLLANGNRGPARVVLTGPGGFGKTTLAALAEADPQVARRFRERRYWVTLSELTREPELHEHMRDLIREISGEPSPYTTPEATRAHLAKLLSARPTLLVVDDVWDPGQLEPFALGDCVLLVTTRLAALPGASVHVVERMPDEQAHELLAGGLPAADEPDWARLLRLCGGWPILLTLVHDMVSFWVGTQGEPIAAAVRHVADQLETAGPTALDPERRMYRQEAVAAAVEASVRMLATARRPHWSRRFTELAVVPKSAAIPLATLTTFWHDDMTDDEVEDFCRGLVRLSLAKRLEFGETPALRLHDVIHEYLVHSAQENLPALHARLLDAYAPDHWWHLPEDEPYLWDHLAYHLGQVRPGGADELVCDLRWIEARLRRDGPIAIDADFAHATSDLAARMRTVLARSAHLLAPLDPEPSLAATIASRLRDTEPLNAAAERHERDLRGMWLEPVWPLPDEPAPAYSGAIATGTSGVRSLAVAPDGTWLATGHEDGAVRTWDLDTGRPLAEAWPHKKVVNVVRISAEGRVASAEVNGPIAVWDPVDDEVRWCQGYRSFTSDIAIDPERGRLAVCGGRDLGVRFFDQKGAPVLVRPWWRSLVNFFLADEKLASRIRLILMLVLVAAVGGTDRAMILVMSGLVLVMMAVDFWLVMRGRDLARHRDFVHCICYSADGRFLATGSLGGATVVWHAASGRRRRTFDDASSSVGSVALDPTGEWLATANRQDGFRLRRVRTGQERVVEALPSAPKYTVCFSSDGTMVACAANIQVRVWTVDDGTPKGDLTELPHLLSDVSFSPDNALLITAGAGSSVQRWQLADLPVTGEPAKEVMVRGIAFCADGDSVVIGGPESDVVIRSVRGTTRSLPGHTASISAVATAPDGSCFASGDFAGVVRRWQADGTPMAVPIEHSAGATNLVIAPDGRLAVGCQDCTIHVYDATGGTITLTSHTAEDNIRFGITGLAVTADSTRLVSADSRGVIRVWDTSTWRSEVLRDGDEARPIKGIYRVAVSPDGRWVASSGARGATIEVRLLTDGTVRYLDGHTSWVSGVAFSPDGTMLASAGFDGVVRVWRLPAFTCVAALRMDGWFSSCAWSPSSRQVAVSGSGGAYLFTLRPD